MNIWQILSYLVACDHLCQLGYDMSQVEEALEMFQNCETKVSHTKSSNITRVFKVIRDNKTWHFSSDEVSSIRNFKESKCFLSRGKGVPTPAESVQ